MAMDLSVQLGLQATVPCSIVGGGDKRDSSRGMSIGVDSGSRSPLEYHRWLWWAHSHRQLNPCYLWELHPTSRHLHVIRPWRDH